MCVREGGVLNLYFDSVNICLNHFYNICIGSSPHTNFDYSHGRGGSFRGGRGRGGNSYYSDRGSMAGN